jgi:hypothetical protein
VTDASGRAEFTDLAITGDPGARTLAFSAPGFDPVNSSAIDVQAAPPAGTTTTITSAEPNPSTAGAPVLVQFTVASAAGTPSGTVTVSDGVDSCSGALSSGAGNCSITFTTVGARTLTATYQPAGSDFGGSSGTASHQVDAPTSGLTAARGAAQ